MKKFCFLTLFAAVGILASCAQPAPANYQFSAPLGEDADDFMAYIINYDNGEKVDSVMVADGVAAFKGNIDKPMLARLMLENDRVATFILEPGTLKFNPETREFSGTPLNDRLNKIGADLQAVAAEYRALPPAQQDSLGEVYQARYEKVFNDAFEQNLDNPIGYYIFMDQASSFDLNQLDEALKKYPQFAGSKRLASLRESLILKQETSPGKMYKDFAVTYNGKTQKLSDFVGNGKWLLVDFWASWCGPCRREIPVIKEILNEYGPKGLQVLGVAVWDEPENTLKAMEQLDITWPVILNAQTIPTDLYGISGIPCIILIDPQGKIVSRDKQDAELRQDVANAIDGTTVQK